MRTLLLISFSLIGYISYSQNEVPPSIGEPKKYTDTHIDNKNGINYVYDASAVTQKPQFPQGNEKLAAFISQNYIFSKAMIENNISGKIFASFIVERDGSVTDIKVFKDLGFGTGKEAIRVLKKMPAWIPGKINNKAVRVNYFIPVFINAKK